LNLNLIGNQLVSFGNRWISDLKTNAPSEIPTITASNALVRSATELGHITLNPTEIRRAQNKLGQDTKIVFAPGDLSRTDIETELVWLKGDHKEVLLCWTVTIAEIANENIWQIFIDAHSGAYVRKDNLVLHCDFGTPENVVKEKYNSLGLVLPVESPMPPVPDSSYNVFATPVESPNHGTRSIQTRPWLAAGVGNPAITKGWHNNGTTNYSYTRGNNVDAYEDIDNNNLPGLRPDTFNLRFDYPFTSTANATVNLKSCITNLFYWNNLIHDIMYQYGFNEVSGNFQNNNLGRGGLGNDYVKAEAQDGGGTNNANFNTPVDGGSGRMQMYLWSPFFDESPLTINTPPSISGSMFAIESAFSTNNKIFNIGLKAGDFVLVNDAIGDTHQACGDIANAESLPGKIAIIDRGTCDFVTKVKAVQLLGAIAAIVINNVPDDPIAMGGTDNTIVIPSVMIGMADGNNLKSVMISNTVNGSLDGIRPDGDFDSGIITHEYGHGISTRLTGGPANSSCLNNAEQMGEGWSDFFSLMLTTDWPNASPTDLRGIGTYALGQPTNGTGIRTYPYTIDQDVNPFTYADVANSTSAHYIGSVWCTILWDMAWSIIEMEGVDPDMYHGTGGNNIALQLVIDGLKLQPCSPGFVDGRDAILLADKLNYGGAHSCAIWNAFAGRGLGTGASQGSSNSNTDGVESFTVPAGIRIKSSTNAPLGAGEGQDVTFNVKTICECEGKSDLTIEDVLSSDLTYIPGIGGTLNGNKVQFSADTLAPMDSLEFTYHAFVKPCSAVSTVLLNSDNAETPDQYHTVKLAGTGTKAWVKSVSQFVSPTRSWYAQDYTNLADFVLLLNSAVSATPGIIEIAFNHRYVTEATYDGGTVEYSINGGTTWLDAGPYFVENGYPSFINKNGVIINAFSGNSDTQYGITGFLHSTIRIPVVSNASMLVRFRMYCDGGVAGGGINGWYLDDIYINHISGAANKTRTLAEGIVIDSLLYSQRTTIFTGDKIYVDPSATGNRSGVSWANAMHYLPNAMDVAGCRTADSVFVAQGTYLPNLNNNRSLSFKVPNNTLVFGGFPSGGSPFSMRNPAS
ncbi:MAG: M36 family metallopeptidase, partial [Saprospiraceae bacterium]|nr:M36 family metallopeptidase [Saprospiraceae bacterium]